ncbi:hypothetical protein ACGK9U_11280 [Mariniflexile sp. HNIBRBA6329]|uniref:hypothetical protein n=1 Tax=Mariniflexile sp. HNIBRBA6329 TaxID=3373088 RepID=UPI003745A369
MLFYTTTYIFKLKVVFILLWLYTTFSFLQNTSNKQSVKPNTKTLTPKAKIIYQNQLAEHQLGIPFLSIKSTLNQFTNYKFKKN